MTLKIRVSSNPNGDGDLRKSIDGGGDYELLTTTERQMLSGGSPVDAGNVTTGEDVLKTVTLAASLLATRNGIKVTSHGSWANNANAKSVRLYFGGSEVLQVNLPINTVGKFVAEMTVYRIDASNQRAIADFRGLNTTTPSAPVAVSFQNAVDVGADETTALIAKISGEGTATNDIVAGSFRVEAF